MKSIFQSFKARVLNAIDANAEKRAYGAVNVLRTHILVSLANQPARTGRTYKIPGTDQTYTASAPGEYPALREGHLRASVAKAGIKVRRRKGAVRAEFGGGFAKHGEHLEAGLRPWFSKAAEEKKSEMESAMRGRWF